MALLRRLHFANEVHVDEEVEFLGEVKIVVNREIFKLLVYFPEHGSINTIEIVELEVFIRREFDERGIHTSDCNG